MPTPPEAYAGRVDVLTGYAEDAAARGEVLVYVRIPWSLGPLERGARLEDPLSDALLAAGVGVIAGGGSQLGDDNEVVYCGVDVRLTDRERGLPVLRAALRRLGVPDSSRIEEFLPEWSESEI